MTPTERTLQECRRLGHKRTGVVERWIPSSIPTGKRDSRGRRTFRLKERGKRVDLFGFGDVLSLDRKPGSLMIQATSRGGVPARIRKLCGDPDPEVLAAVVDWLLAGNRLVIWGWYRGSKPVNRRLWRYREEVLTLQDPRVIAARREHGV